MRTYMLYHNFKLKLFVDMCKHDSGLTNYKKKEQKNNCNIKVTHLLHGANTYVYKS